MFNLINNITKPLEEIVKYIGFTCEYTYNRLYNAKSNLLKDLPTDTNCDWINKRNQELNKIPLCKSVKR
jgi:hypothetical protein